MLSELRTTIRKCLIWISRFRQRRGYGVHSPFAFNLIKGVFYERGIYYAYARLRDMRHCTPPHRRENSEKVDKMLFRLANYTCADIIWVGGTCTELTSMYLESARPHAILRRYADEEELCLALRHEKTTPDFLYIAGSIPFENALHLLSQKATNKTVTAIAGIHANHKRLQQWKKARDNEKSGISFDLYDIGILFYDQSYNKQDYTINF